ncbi:uncharacterized protein C8R40DRAFT_1035802, partial [Lentinula edodes]|uniref:uncharacterized protein n=1 Tax=Lentinula edodes TaxID=5353 RepID=UPI001E8CD09F
KNNSLLVSPGKSWVMLFGRLPLVLPQLTLSDKPLKFRDVGRYVGIFFQSTHRNMFAPHYTKKRNAAVGTARAITGCDLLVGNRRMPPSITKQLYTALVDCHLTNGCEIISDTDPSLIQILEDVQIRFLCRMLNLSNNSVITPLFTESGIMPIRTRRASLALRYLKYLITLPPSHYAFSALWDNDNLCRAGSPCWLSDLDYAISQLPGHHRLPHLQDLNNDCIDTLIKTIEFSTKSELQSHIDTWSKLSLLRNRLEPKEAGPAKQQIIGLQHYLTQIKNHAHRRTVTKPLCGDLTPQVFRASASPLRPLTPTEVLNRACRACNLRGETPQHLLFQCPSLTSITSLRSEFFLSIRQSQPLLRSPNLSDSTALHYPGY